MQLEHQFQGRLNKTLGKHRGLAQRCDYRRNSCKRGKPGQVFAGGAAVCAFCRPLPCSVTPFLHFRLRPWPSPPIPSPSYPSGSISNDFTLRLCRHLLDEQGVTWWILVASTITVPAASVSQRPPTVSPFTPTRVRLKFPLLRRQLGIFASRRIVHRPSGGLPR